MEMESKYENANGNLQNGNVNGFFYAEMETKTEWCFPVEHTWRRNFPFPLIWNFRFYYRPMAAL